MNIEIKKQDIQSMNLFIVEPSTYAKRSSFLY